MSAHDASPSRWTPQALHYPPQLPVVARRDDILAAIDGHQVVVIAGETGSGKTTQIPKMCLELGRGRPGSGGTGIIAHTQPRRIAARAVAERVAAELGVSFPGPVGYQVRFVDDTTDETAIKVMTDGILLGELQHDPDLRRYDTVIIDEAHERSLNIDFLIGYLKQLLPRRPDLKVIITSATIEPEKFARHFSDPVTGDPAPVLTVSGRTYPVEIRYRPLVDPDRPDEPAADILTGVADAVTELWTESPRDGGPDDILVFLSGEREIRDAVDALQSLALPQTEVVPLFGRLSAAEQHRVFTRGRLRRIIVATNVAETSLTVPGIRYVVDGGTARISRYSQRTKVQRLPIEPISQASANQRAGRCGRLADGICVRLYAESDYDQRPAFTDPEVVRTNLAAVILTMTALGLGDVAAFPFLDPPDHRQVSDGVRLLTELGAFAPPKNRGGSRRRRPPGTRRLSTIGRQLSRLPVDPRLARMLIASHEQGCLEQVLIIVAGLSIQDPRERPTEQRAEADRSHARFADPRSDFMGYLALWYYLADQRKERSSSAFRRLCRAEYLHYLRVREWQDVHAQLRRATKALGYVSSAGSGMSEAVTASDAIHRAVVAGLLSHIGLWDERTRDYRGARGSRFSLSPGSALFKKNPELVMAAELVETTRLWAHTAAAVDPIWVEQAAGDLVTRSHANPRWSASRGSAVITERVSLFGVPLIADRAVLLERVDRELARELFIRHALVEGEWDSGHTFQQRNAEVIATVNSIHERTRAAAPMVDDDAIYEFYSARIPADVTTVRHFDAWWKRERRAHPDRLTLTEAELTKGQSGGTLSEYPSRWRQGDLEFRISYQFSPGQPGDGVSVHIPVAVLNQVRDTGFDWLVPGMRDELAIAWIKALPKGIRRQLAPAPDRAAAALAVMSGPENGPFASELASALREITGVSTTSSDWDPQRLPAHLRMNFVIEDPRGAVVGSGTDLEQLRRELAPQTRASIASATDQPERVGLTSWTIGSLPATATSAVNGMTLTGYPALVDRGDSADLVILDRRDSAEAATQTGIRRLLLLAVPAPWKRVLATLSGQEKLALAQGQHSEVPDLLEDVRAAAVDDIVIEHCGGYQGIRDEPQFEAAAKAVRSHLAARSVHLVRLVLPILSADAAVRENVAAVAGAARAGGAPWLGATVADATAQHESLIYPGFITAAGAARLPDIERYLGALSHRLTKAGTNAREPALLDEVDAIEGEYADVLARWSGPIPPQLRDVAWMIEEWRVALFAQSFGARGGPSSKKIRAAIAAAASNGGGAQ